jgi:hypothetical protein
VALSQTARVAIVGVVGAVAAYFVFGGGLGGPSVTDPNAAVPRDSFLVASVDAQELRRSPLWTTLAGKDGAASARALGVGPLADACGFDPLSRVVRMAVAMPEAGERGDVGLAARVEVSREELERCTRALAEKRGGAAVEPREQNGFHVIDGPHGARLAYGKGGLLVAGKGAWLDAMLAAARGAGPGLRDAREHVALRDALTRHEGFRAPTVLVTALLPKSLRERLKREMGAELDAPELDRPASNQVMAGVLGVSAVGAAVKAGAPGGNVEVAIEMQCDSAEACTVVEKLILKKRLEWSKDLVLRLAGFGQAIDSLDVKVDGAHLRATATSGADALAGAIDRALRRGGGAPRQEGAPPAPDERMRAAPAADAGSRPRP